MLIPSPAKLNIRLKVTGRRPDGYHELVSIMVPVTLFDQIKLETGQSPGITISSSGFSVPVNDDNLACRAAKAFFSKTGLKQNLSIKLQKNIPVAAGLGGGSSNAACTLKALNEIWSNPLSLQELEKLAVKLGADVPFFLYNRPCIARGIGEILEPISKWPRFWYVIVKPTIKISTAWVYENFKLRLTTNENIYILRGLGKDRYKIIDILENDLESVTASHFPVINTIKKALKNAGAEGVLMSGSGPSVFGIFKSKNHAMTAKEKLASRNQWKVYAVRDVEKSNHLK